MNYALSIMGMSSSPSSEAGQALHSISICDSLMNDVKASEYKDIMSIARLSSCSYYLVLLNNTLYHRIYTDPNYKDEKLDIPFYYLSLLKDIKERKTFSEKELIEIYFILDLISFFKAYCPFIMEFTSEDRDKEIIDYGYKIDAISKPILEAIAPDKNKPLVLTTAEFEEIMLKSTEIKVKMMNLLTYQFYLLSKEQQQ